MELVITKEFLDDFFISFDEGNKYHTDFKEFLTQKLKALPLLLIYKMLQNGRKHQEKILCGKTYWIFL
jgi:hypothetical protein